MKLVQRMQQVIFRASLALLLLVVAVVIFPRVHAGITSLEYVLMDMRHHVAPSTYKQDVVIVEIDTASLSRYDTWPWPRSYYADVTKILKKYGASAIGFDVIFDSVSGHNPQEDQRFSQALKEAGNVVLASKWFRQERGGYHVSGWSNPIELFRHYADTGFVNKPIDPDNRVRRAWLRTTQHDETHISWVTRLVEKAGFSVSDATDDFTVHYHGPARSFTTVPFFVVKEDKLPNPSIFYNKIVLIGASDPILHDFFYTPFGIMPGVEIHANAIQGLLNNDYLSLAPQWANVLLIVAFLFLVGRISNRESPLKAFLWVMGLLFAYSALAVWVFVKAGLFITWAYPLVLSALMFVGFMLKRYIAEEKEKRYIKSLFQQYVAPTVVSELLKDPTKINLGGESRDVTIFFSDIRSFTTYSEKHDPAYVVDMLNEYLDAMTQCIFKWQGTLDKYVGDEIMAIWGAPLDQPNHPELALKCCWEQLGIMRDLREKWKAEGKDPVDIGMGLNTGEVIVGNIGSTMYKDYTVIGDSVNLAARLEAETRHHGTKAKPCYLIISEFTYKRVKHICEVKSLGKVQVKGKRKMVSIYEVLSVTI